MSEKNVSIVFRNQVTARARHVALAHPPRRLCVKHADTLHAAHHHLGGPLVYLRRAEHVASPVKYLTDVAKKENMDTQDCALLFLMFLLAYAGHLIAAFGRPPERLSRRTPPASCAACVRIRVDPGAAREITGHFMMLDRRVQGVSSQ